MKNLEGYMQLGVATPPYIHRVGVGAPCNVEMATATSALTHCQGATRAILHQEGISEITFQVSLHSYILSPLTLTLCMS
jgi:hypothetical protein